jgi:hypothetical protein
MAHCPATTGADLLALCCTLNLGAVAILLGWVAGLSAQWLAALRWLLPKPVWPF